MPPKTIRMWQAQSRICVNMRRLSTRARRTGAGDPNQSAMVLKPRQAQPQHVNRVYRRRASCAAGAK
ncbi:hypothetical protein KCP69_26240 [Salmonella enterica subsp. enterica]|nr:hypothetical protein KCP69_26240 [Salmonella enterica subsp. enterica]